MLSLLDYDQCDLEPISFINSIQTFGAIIVIDENRKIKCHSKNIFTFCGLGPQTLLNKDFDPEVFSSDDFNLTEIKVKNLKVIQLEKISNKEETPSLFDLFDLLQKTTALEDLLSSATKIVESITGFDRVMFYKFHEDSHGEVVAETTKTGVESFLGLHYPASDIPTPARNIFFKNWIRMIPDVDYDPIALESSLPEPLDLGQVLMRAVSPIHILYLKNMKVGATLTISIIVENKLWGLVACHHLSPKYITKPVREKCDVIGRYISSLISETLLKENASHALRTKELLSSIAHHLEKSDDMARDLMTQSKSLMDLLKAQGSSAALYANGNWLHAGTAPSRLVLNRLVDWLAQEHPEESVYHSHEVSVHFPEASAYKEIASGILAISIPKTIRNYIFFFRPEAIQTVTWAGNPDKTISEDDGKIWPRSSFQEWKKIYYGKSLPWQSWEIDAAFELRNIILVADLKEQFIKEQKALAQSELAKQAREDLMAVVSHDLRNPLNSIQLSTQLLKRKIPKDNFSALRLTETILKSTSTMANLISDILSVTKFESGHSEVYKTLNPIILVLQDAFEMLSPIASQNNITLILEKKSSDYIIDYDIERILQVLSNLIGNSIKFTPEGGAITISVEKHSPLYIKIKVFDTGHGIPAENLPFIFDRFWQAKQTNRMGVGLGLSIAKGIVVSHGGEIWAESKIGIGSSFHFTLPAQLE